jgi:hypothetical protein
MQHRDNGLLYAGEFGKGCRACPEEGEILSVDWFVFHHSLSMQTRGNGHIFHPRILGIIYITYIACAVMVMLYAVERTAGSVNREAWTN